MQKLQDVESVEENIAVETKQAEVIEMDELFDYMKKRVCVVKLVTRKPQQIVGFDVAHDKSEKRIQKIVDS